MTAEGFCLEHARDVVMDGRYCPEHGTPCIPPSWGSRHQMWINDTWWPEKARPDGYVYRPPAHVTTPRPAPATDNPQRHRKPAPKRARAPQSKFRPSPGKARIRPNSRPAAQIAATCPVCHKRFEYRRTGGNERLYCTPACRSRQRVLEKSAQFAASLPTSITCRLCGAEAPPITQHKRPARGLCPACRDRHAHPRPMYERGMRCRRCGSDQKIHKARGLCPTCWAHERQEELRAS